MTPARLAEIRAYIRRLDLDQLPPWTREQAIIRDLFEALPEAWDEGRAVGVASCGTLWMADRDATDPRTIPNPYRDQADAS